jgi:hypothetical protein
VSWQNAGNARHKQAATAASEKRERRVQKRRVRVNKGKIRFEPLWPGLRGTPVVDEMYFGLE